MSTRESLLRYIHITNRLRKSAATFGEINQYLKQQSELQGYRFNVSKQQFQRDLEDIGSIFEIEINYDFKQRVYAINEEPQEVILSFDPVQGKYIKSLPLHESQQIIIDNNTELQIKLFLYTTYDFEMELLSYGEYVKVLKPDSLIEVMKNRYSKALNIYRIKP